MNPRLLFLAAACAAALCSSARADGPAAVQPPPDTGVEPKVQRIVIEDDNVRIEELRVRGQTQRIVVKPKGAKSYEVLPATQGRDMSDSPTSQRGAAGKRVWNVLSF